MAALLSTYVVKTVMTARTKTLLADPEDFGHVVLLILYVPQLCSVHSSIYTGNPIHTSSPN